MGPPTPFDWWPWCLQHFRSKTCRIYNTPSRHKPVWQRLEADAVTRQSLPTKQYSFWSGHGPENNEGGGYSQSVSFKQLTQPPPGAKQMVDPPAESLHRITLERYRQKYPLEFYAAIRPNTETVSQTLRCEARHKNVSSKMLDAGPAGWVVDLTPSKGIGDG